MLKVEVGDPSKSSHRWATGLWPLKNIIYNYFQWFPNNPETPRICIAYVYPCQVEERICNSDENGVCCKENQELTNGNIVRSAEDIPLIARLKKGYGYSAICAASLIDCKTLSWHILGLWAWWKYLIWYIWTEWQGCRSCPFNKGQRHRQDRLRQVMRPWNVA